MEKQIDRNCDETNKKGSPSLCPGEISVVIPMYNAEKTIVRTLDAINSQVPVCYFREIIVVDDGSADASAQIVEEYAKTSTIPILLIRQKNGGVSKARNVGMQAASGSWIALCDADDVWLPGKTAVQVEAINTGQIDFLGANWLDSALKIYGKPITSLRRLTVKDLCIKMLVQTSTIIMKKSIFEEIGGFNEGQSYSEDANFILNVAAQYNAFYLPVQAVNYGDGKRGFGVSGLSANMREMYKGVVFNLKEMLAKGYIAMPFFLMARVIQLLKYARRLAITSVPFKGTVEK